MLIAIVLAHVYIPLIVLIALHTRTMPRCNEQRCYGAKE